MANRIGAGRGTGKGYKNLRSFPKDSSIHSQSAKGMKQPQKIQNLRNKPTSKTLRVQYIGDDYWGRKLFQNLDNPKRVYAEVDGVLHTTTGEGEPDSPLKNKIEDLTIMKTKDLSSEKIIDGKKFEIYDSFPGKEEAIDTANHTRTISGSVFPYPSRTEVRILDGGESVGRLRYALYIRKVN